MNVEERVQRKEKGIETSHSSKRTGNRGVTSNKNKREIEKYIQQNKREIEALHLTKTKGK